MINFFLRLRTAGGKLILLPIRFYRKYLSRLKGRPTCRYYPSCSVYAMSAVERFGPVKGLWLAFLRILRCNPLFPGGVDPVPEDYRYFQNTKAFFRALPLLFRRIHRTKEKKSEK